MEKKKNNNQQLKIPFAENYREINFSFHKHQDKNSKSEESYSAKVISLKEFRHNVEKGLLNRFYSLSDHLD